MRPARPTPTGVCNRAAATLAAEVARSQKAPLQGNSPNDRILRGPDCYRPKRVCADSFPAPPLPQVPECSLASGMRLGRHAESIGPMTWQKPSPDRTGVPPPVGRPGGFGGPYRESIMTSFSRLPSFAGLFQECEGALVKRISRQYGRNRFDVSSHLLPLGRGSRFRSGRCQGIGHAGKNMPCPSSAMSSGRLFLDRVARQHCPSPLHRHTQVNMHSTQAQGKGDISTLRRRGHFYFALTQLSQALTTR